MTQPHLTESDLHAYLDGELDGARRGEVEALVASHRDDAERLAAYSALNDALRACYDPVLGEPIPERLSQLIARRPWRILRYAAALGWLALGGLAGWQLHGIQGRDDPSAAPAWARRAAVAHVVYAPEVRHPVEVGADQEAHLVAWLSKRLGTELRIPQLNGIGYSLVGGRLLPGEQGPAAQF
ncbi:MAG TPA: anti-sigma factor, partial [Burkholderiales bacterium]|nr:anti-sigma factor [Burkholderiales bacterium]